MVRTRRAPTRKDMILQRVMARLRSRRTRRVSAAVPRSDQEIAAAAASIGLSIPEDRLPGVATNLALIERHVTVMRKAAAP